MIRFRKIVFHVLEWNDVPNNVVILATRKIRFLLETIVYDHVSFVLRQKTPKKSFRLFESPLKTLSNVKHDSTYPSFRHRFEEKSYNYEKWWNNDTNMKLGKYNTLLTGHRTYVSILILIGEGEIFEPSKENRGWTIIASCLVRANLFVRGRNNLPGIVVAADRRGWRRSDHFGSDLLPLCGARSIRRHESRGRKTDCVRSAKQMLNGECVPRTACEALAFLRPSRACHDRYVAELRRYVRTDRKGWFVRLVSYVVFAITILRG